MLEKIWRARKKNFNSQTKQFQSKKGSEGKGVYDLPEKPGFQAKALMAELWDPSLFYMEVELEFI